MITNIDPYVISQYVINFAHGMQEENTNELVANLHAVVGACVIIIFNFPVS